MYVGDAYWGVELCPTYQITLRYGQPRGSSDDPHQNLTAKLLKPKDGGRFNLAIKNNISHQMDSRSLRGQYLKKIV